MAKQSTPNPLPSNPQLSRFVGEIFDEVEDRPKRLGAKAKKYPVVVTVYEDPTTGRRGVFASWPLGQPNCLDERERRSATLRAYHKHRGKLP